MRPGLAIYLLVGLCWQAFNYYGSPLSERLREEQIEAWKRGWRFRPLQIVAFVVGVTAWPITILLIPLVLRTFFPKQNDKLHRYIRREYIDRKGLLTPQMPAERCWVCDAGMDRIQQSCDKCKLVWDLDHCKACCDKNACVVGCQSWRCPKCVDQFKPCPWCHIPVKELGEHGDKVTLQHFNPLCDGWKAMMASPNPSKYMRDAFERGEIQPAAVQVKCVACLDCGLWCDSTVANVPLSSDAAAEFEREHADHRMEAVLADGKRMRIAGPGWNKETTT